MVPQAHPHHNKDLLHYDPRGSTGSGMEAQHMGPNHLDGFQYPGPIGIVLQNPTELTSRIGTARSRHGIQVNICVGHICEWNSGCIIHDDMSFSSHFCIML
jgi:hypothetical protein